MNAKLVGPLRGDIIKTLQSILDCSYQVLNGMTFMHSEMSLSASLKAEEPDVMFLERCYKKMQVTQDLALKFNEFLQEWDGVRRQFNHTVAGMDQTFASYVRELLWTVEGLSFIIQKLSLPGESTIIKLIKLGDDKRLVAGQISPTSSLLFF